MWRFILEKHWSENYTIFLSQMGKKLLKIVIITSNPGRRCLENVCLKRGSTLFKQAKPIPAQECSFSLPKKTLKMHQEKDGEPILQNNT
jgi:hypothetical protein